MEQAISVKEKEVLALISAGYSSRAIAIHLNKSFHTVTAQRKSLLRKLEAGNAAELIKKAVDKMLIAGIKV